MPDIKEGLMVTKDSSKNNDNNYDVLSVYSVPDTVLNTFYLFIHFIFSKTQRSRHNCYHLFSNKETHCGYVIRKTTELGSVGIRIQTQAF